MLTRWDPFREMLNLRNTMDRFLENSIQDTFNGLETPVWSVALDVAENEDEYIVKASVPGINPDDLDITYTGSTLTIRGETRVEKEDGDESRYHLRERRFGRFSRSVALPERVEADKIQADYANGVLTLHLPKAEEVKPKRIQIKAGKSKKMIEG